MADSSITKRALAQALKDLLEEEPFEKVSVSAICEACGMNRKSFYYHFKDKYDLVAWIYDSEFVTPLRASKVEVGWDLLEQMCAYFAQNRTFYAKTLAYEGQNSLSSYFYEVATGLLNHELDGHADDAELQHPETRAFVVTFFADALTAAIKRWIFSGCPQEPAEFVGLLHFCLYNVPGLHQSLS